MYHILLVLIFSIIFLAIFMKYLGKNRIKKLFFNKERFQILIIFILLLDLQLAMFCKMLINLWLKQFILWEFISFILNSLCIAIMYKNTKNIIKHFYYGLKTKVNE